jgi:hypothetical protein
MEIQATKGVMMVGERLLGIMPAGSSFPVLQQGHLIISKPTRRFILSATVSLGAKLTIILPLSRVLRKREL